MVIGLFYQQKKRKQKYLDHVKLSNDSQFGVITGKIEVDDEELHDMEKINNKNHCKRSESDSPDENESLSSNKSKSSNLSDTEKVINEIEDKTGNDIVNNNPI